MPNPKQYLQKEIIPGNNLSWDTDGVTLNADVPSIEANPQDTATDTLESLEIDGTVYDLGGGTEVEANPSDPATDTLSSIDIDGTVYDLGGGTEVEANPSDPATDTLSTIDIAGTVYSIEGGGGGGISYDYYLQDGNIGGGPGSTAYATVPLDKTLTEGVYIAYTVDSNGTTGSSFFTWGGTNKSLTTGSITYTLSATAATATDYSGSWRDIFLTIFKLNSGGGTGGGGFSAPDYENPETITLVLNTWVTYNVTENGYIMVDLTAFTETGGTSVKVNGTTLSFDKVVGTNYILNATYMFPVMKDDVVEIRLNYNSEGYGSNTALFFPAKNGGGGGGGTGNLNAVEMEYNDWLELSQEEREDPTIEYFLSNAPGGGGSGGGDLSAYELTQNQYNNLPTAQKLDDKVLYFINNNITTEEAIDVTDFVNKVESGGAMTITADATNNTLTYTWGGASTIGANSFYPTVISSNVTRIDYKITTSTSYTTSDDQFKIGIGVKTTYDAANWAKPTDNNWVAIDIYNTQNTVIEGSLDLSEVDEDTYFYICGHGWNMTIEDLTIVTVNESTDPTKIMYKDVEYGNGSGSGSSEVIPNPQGTATDTLNTVEIDGTIFDLPSGGGGSSIIDEIWTGNETPPTTGTVITLTKKWNDYDFLCFLVTNTTASNAPYSTPIIMTKDMIIDTKNLQAAYGYNRFDVVVTPKSDTTLQIERPSSSGTAVIYKKIYGIKLGSGGSSGGGNLYGTTDPASNLGNNGDIYMKYANEIVNYTFFEGDGSSSRYAEPIEINALNASDYDVFHVTYNYRGFNGTDTVSYADLEPGVVIFLPSSSDPNLGAQIKLTNDKFYLYPSTGYPMHVYKIIGETETEIPNKIEEVYGKVGNRWLNFPGYSETVLWSGSTTISQNASPFSVPDSSYDDIGEYDEIQIEYESGNNTAAKRYSVPVELFKTYPNETVNPEGRDGISVQRTCYPQYSTTDNCIKIYCESNYPIYIKKIIGVKRGESGANNSTSLYKWYTSNDGTITVRTGPDGTYWFFNGFNTDGGRSTFANIPSELAQFAPSNTDPQLSEAYSDPSGSTVGWIGFYANTIRGWNPTKAANLFTTLYGVVKADGANEQHNGYYNAYTGIPNSGGISYSTAEQVVGTWIDGKPLYQKTVEYSSVTTNAWNEKLIDADADLINIEGYLLTSAGWKLPLNYDTGSSYFSAIMGYRSNNTYAQGYLSIYTNASNASSAIVTVRYTKTTD